MTQEQGEHSNCKTHRPCQSLEPSLVTFGNGKPQIELPSPRADTSGGTLNSLQTRPEPPFLPNLFHCRLLPPLSWSMSFFFGGGGLFPPGPLFQAEIDHNHLGMI